MEWIYLSPHLDDIALSCGGLVWQQSQSGEVVQVWSVCAGDPPGESVSQFAESLHNRWSMGHEAAELRRSEDAASCAEMGAMYRHFSWPDCIYRLGPENSPYVGVPLYDSEESLWLPVHPAENVVIQQIRAELNKLIPTNSQIVCPLTLGGHVDHRLTRQAAELLGRRMWYYADYPYALEKSEELDKLRQEGWKESRHSINRDGLEAWIAAVAAHRSQISTFWHKDSGRRVPEHDAMRTAITQYCQAMGGVVLWLPPNP